MGLYVESRGSGPDRVPLAAGEYLQRVLPQAVIEVYAGTAHALFRTRPQRAARRITEFCGEP